MDCCGELRGCGEGCEWRLGRRLFRLVCVSCVWLRGGREGWNGRYLSGRRFGSSSLCEVVGVGSGRAALLGVMLIALV
jgi:hypothetical protein